MKYFLTSILLGVAIVLIAVAIHTNDGICACIGGFLVGIYNAMISKRD
jgi:hypothetical protein